MNLGKRQLYNRKYDITAANGMEKSVRSSQMMTICQIEMGISVASTQGMEAEKNNMDETDTTPMVNRAGAEKSVDWIAGKNISANPLARALEI